MEKNEDELLNSCRKAIKLLKEKGNPYTKIIISMDCIKIVEETQCFHIKD